MAKNTQLTTEVVNAQADAMGALANNGWIDCYDGTQPADSNTAVSTQTLLASLRLNATAFGAAVVGVITANAITSAVAGSGGTATWFRVRKADHSTALWDGTIDTATANMILPSTTITAGQTVSCSSLTHTVPKATTGF